MPDKPNPLPVINGRQVLSVAPNPDGGWWIVAEWNDGGAVLASTRTLADEEWGNGRYYDSPALALLWLADRLTVAYRQLV